MFPGTFFNSDFHKSECFFIKPTLNFKRLLFAFSACYNFDSNLLYYTFWTTVELLTEFSSDFNICIYFNIFLIFTKVTGTMYKTLIIPTYLNSSETLLELLLQYMKIQSVLDYI